MEWGAVRTLEGPALRRSAFGGIFRRNKPKERAQKRSEYASTIVAGEADSYREMDRGMAPWRESLVPFHWEIEFPEVFERTESGFRRVRRQSSLPWRQADQWKPWLSYKDWLLVLQVESNGNTDLAARFFRRAYELLRSRCHAWSDRDEYNRPGRYAPRRPEMDLR